MRQLPSGAFPVRFQHDRASYAATYLTRELAEEAEPLLRAAVMARRCGKADVDHDAVAAPSIEGSGPTLGPGTDAC
jgi:hypothetical protein